MDPLEFRRRNMVREGDDMLSTHAEPEEDVHYGSYGLDQCTRLVQDALARGRERYRAAGLDDLGPDWVIGEGTALSMIDTVPPRGHFAHSRLRLLPDGTYAADVGTAEFGNGTTTVHAQLAATALSTTAGRIAVRQSDTDLVEHDTGAFGSAGTVVAGKATLAAAEDLAVRIRASPPASARSRPPAACWTTTPSSAREPGCRWPKSTTPPRRPASSSPPRGIGAGRRVRWRSTSRASGWP